MGGLAEHDPHQHSNAASKRGVVALHATAFVPESKRDFFQDQGMAFLFGESTPGPCRPRRVNVGGSRTSFIFSSEADDKPLPFGSGFASEDELGPDTQFDVDFRRKFHNWSLDKGMKFMINYKSPLIKNTDLFDLLKFGCWGKLRNISGEGLAVVGKRMAAQMSKWM